MIDKLLPKSILRGTNSEPVSVMVPFLKCLAGGLRHFMAIRNGPALNSVLERMISSSFFSGKGLSSGSLIELSAGNREGGGLTRL